MGTRDTQMDIIAEYYIGLRDFKQNDGYSDDRQRVYTSADYDGWLVLERKDANTIQARLTDESGVILSWDNYAVKNADIRLVEAVRLSVSGRNQILFTPQEVAVIDRYGDYDRRTTAGKLDILLERFKDEATKSAAATVIEKLGRISDQAYTDMYDVGQKRREKGMEQSLHGRLKAAKVKADAYNAERTVREPKRGKGQVL